MKSFYLFLIIILCSACAGPIEKLYPPPAQEPAVTIYLVSHGWHTGIVVKLEDVPAGVWPEIKDFADVNYVEVGWGDRDFYQAPEITLWNKLKAGLWPTPGVLHIVGFNTTVDKIFPQSEIIGLELSVPGFKALCRYIHNSYEKDAMGNVIPLGHSLYGDGQFYSSNDNYHLFKTCNVWTAKAIRSAGFPIRPFFSITTEGLMSKVRKHGKVVLKPQIK